VLDAYGEGDVVEGKVTKVVTFGAFVEILPGVEGLVHISELAPHHVENPREVVSQGDAVRVKVIEVDAERRRLSLSLKRVEDGAPVRAPDAGVPQLDLSEDVFPESVAGAAEPSAVEALEPVAHGTLEPDPDAQEATESESSSQTPVGDESIEADRAAPDQPGPGDSDADYPASPTEDEERP
jgi:small subunit ribosomal protein S1